MTPLFTRYPPLAARTLLLAVIGCLPLAGLISHDMLLQHKQTQQTLQLKQQLEIQHQQLREFRAAQRRLLQQQHARNTPQQVIAMLDSIASRLTPDITVVASNADGRTSRVHLTVHAKSLNALLAFTHRLETLPVSVELDNHRHSADKYPDWPVEAAIDVRFYREKKHDVAK